MLRAKQSDVTKLQLQFLISIKSEIYVSIYNRFREKEGEPKYAPSPSRFDKVRIGARSLGVNIIFLPGNLKHLAKQ